MALFNACHLAVFAEFDKLYIHYFISLHCLAFMYNSDKAFREFEGFGGKNHTSTSVLICSFSLLNISYILKQLY